jgi:hypothetical protein
MFDTSKTYWNNNGAHQATYDRLVEAMPMSGKCDTLAGELIRSASRLGYDFYNNGMGNNTSGAVNFLRARGAIDPETHAIIYENTRGKIYRGDYNGDALHEAIERMVDMTCEYIERNPQFETLPNAEDMFDFEDEEERIDWEAEEDDYYDEEYA